MASNIRESEDDSISVTSTVQSDQRSEYDIEKVLAKQFRDGEWKYLVRWEGYPDERCTWEPRSNFKADNIIDDWEASQCDLRLLTMHQRSSPR